MIKTVFYMGKIFKPIIKILYRGGKFTDPIDGKNYRKFLPYGYKKIRLNALSPVTLSLERHRLLWLYLKRETTFMKDKKKVLHIAPEQSFYKRFKKIHFWKKYPFLYFQCFLCPNWIFHCLYNLANQKYTYHF